MILSPNENALIDESLRKVGATFNSLLYISGGEDIDENKIIEALSMSIADLELAQAPLITARNMVRIRKEQDNNDKRIEPNGSNAEGYHRSSIESY